MTLVHEVLAECCPGARLQPHVLGTEAVAALSADADAVAARAAAPLELVLARRGADPAAAAARARSERRLRRSVAPRRASGRQMA